MFFLVGARSPRWLPFPPQPFVVPLKLVKPLSTSPARSLQAQIYLSSVSWLPQHAHAFEYAMRKNRYAHGLACCWRYYRQGDNSMFYLGIHLCILTLLARGPQQITEANEKTEQLNKKKKPKFIVSLVCLNFAILVACNGLKTKSGTTPVYSKNATYGVEHQLQHMG